MKKHTVLFVLTILINSSVIGVVCPLVSAASDDESLFRHQLRDRLFSRAPILHRLMPRFQSEYHDCPSSIQHQEEEAESFVFSPEAITLKDDAFHGGDTFHYTEWWYFDAMLENGYSVQMIIQVIGMVTQRIVLGKINIYRDGELKVHQEQIYLPSDFAASADTPLVKLAGSQVLKGYVDDGRWIYDIALAIEDTSLELQFVSSMRGWKGTTPLGGWAVIQPKAEVTGTIRVNDIELDVQGVGYHDHNWELTIQAGVHFGWYWGKIHTSNATVTWSSLQKTRVTSDPLLVINIGDQNYYTINSEDIEFVVTDFWLDNGKIIPHKMVLIVNTDDVSLYIVMDIQDTHYVKVGSIRYWRYHVVCSGSFQIGAHVETIQSREIAELIRFR